MLETVKKASLPFIMPEIWIKGHKRNLNLHKSNYATISKTTRAGENLKLNLELRLTQTHTHTQREKGAD